MVLSEDGYVRLSPAAFASIALAHVLSEIDTDTPGPGAAGAGASVSAIAGITEWASETLPALSLGWNWRLATGRSPPRYERDGEVRSNIMLVDAAQRDFGPLATDALLRVAVDALDWRQVTADYISRRYA